MWAERDAAVVWHGFTDMSSYLDHCPVVVERAEGHELVDTDGRRYLDAISSLWVNTMGHRVPELDQAVRDQLDLVAHSTLLGNGNRVVVELAEALAEAVPVVGPHFLFASDGASAVEQALKLAFQFWALQGVRGRTSYLAFGAAYHGDTVGALSVGADDGFGAALFDPLRFPVVRAPGYEDPACFDVACRLVDTHAGRLAAVVVEPLVQGAAGMRMAAPQGFEALADACRAADVLLIHDEVATGFGRTGTLFATEQCGRRVRPDLLCLGKGITGGYLPLSVTVAAARIYDAFASAGQAFAHGHSYGGNALAAAVALRHLRLLAERDVLANVAARSAQLSELLAERVAALPGVGGARVKGLLCGVDVAAGTGRAVCDAAVAAGVLLRPIGDTVIVVPPLTIGAAEVERIVDVLAQAIGDRPGRSVRPTITDQPSRREGGSVRSWADRVSAECRAVEDAGQWRSIRDVDEGLVSFASNDYLGLSAHPAVVDAAHAALDRWGTGSGAARLVTGSRPVHTELEAALADWKGETAALLFPTGYAANLGVLATFATPGVRVLSDERNHASIVDGCRLSRAEVSVYRHGDLDHVDDLLRTSPGPAIVVTDTVFSMDGDVAPVAGLADRCAARGALLILDEAHAVLGPEPGPDLEGVDHLRVGTLSKYLGSLGGFVAGARPFVELLVNRARPFIFTTAGTPADAAAGLAALGVLRSREGAELVDRLRANVDLVSPGHPSPIVPVVIGDEAAALAASAALRDRGLLVPAIRPPTVAPGTSRLRISLSATHTPDQVNALLDGLEAVRRAP